MIQGPKYRFFNRFCGVHVISESAKFSIYNFDANYTFLCCTSLVVLKICRIEIHTKISNYNKNEFKLFRRLSGFFGVINYHF